MSNDKQAASPWLIRYKPRPQAQLRLFCFPYAGGGALVFRAWADALPPSVEVCAVQLPGRGSRLREPPYERVAPLVEATARALLPEMNRPFAFFGHSMGALLSFELARWLRREPGRRSPLQLFVSGRRAPQWAAKEEATHELPDAEFREELRRLGGTPKEVLEHPELMELMIPLLRADFALTQTYRYTQEPPLDCPIDAFGGLEDRDVELQSLEAWREQTASAFSLRMIPGDHFFLHSSQMLLLQMLSNDLLRLVQAAGR